MPPLATTLPRAVAGLVLLATIALMTMGPLVCAGVAQAARETDGRAPGPVSSALDRLCGVSRPGL